MDDYPTVSLEEARNRFAELIQRVVNGEEIVITEGGKWLGMLTPPPQSPRTPEEITAARAKVRDAIKASVLMGIEQGLPPPPDSPLWKLVKEDS